MDIVDLHSHPEAKQFTCSMSGRVEIEAGTELAAEGVFVHLPKGEVHGGTNIIEESIVLLY